MTSQSKSKKLWKPPSFEDFNTGVPNKKIKLDCENLLSDVKYQLRPIKGLEPRTIDELATHPKKINEIRNWLKCCTEKNGEKASILLVTGPAGSGKTVTVRLTAIAEGFLVKEWINPVDKTEFKSEPILDSENYEKFTFSETKQRGKFEEFILRSSRYTSLFDTVNPTLIIVEDIPNIFVWNPKQLHEVLQKYKISGKSPLVFIISDDRNLNLHNSLFPNHIKVKFNITNIKFNPVNHSSLMKNLKRLSEYHSDQFSSEFLENLSKNCNGDLRSAISELMLHMKTDASDLAPAAIKQKKLVSKSIKCKDNIKLMNMKDSNVDFYHTMGRILYPKLINEEEKSKCDNPSQLFVYDVKKVAECCSNYFLNTLHENYLLTFGKFSDVVNGSEYFSLCDVIGFYRELEEYTNLIGVIGLMLSNTNPKKNGFNPLRKSASTVNWNLPSDNAEKRMKYWMYNLSGNNDLLDYIPYMKVFERRNQLSDFTEEELSKMESDEDNVEIEEIED